MKERVELLRKQKTIEREKSSNDVVAYDMHMCVHMLR